MLPSETEFPCTGSMARLLIAPRRRVRIQQLCGDGRALVTAPEEKRKVPGSFAKYRTLPAVQMTVPLDQLAPAASTAKGEAA